MTVNFHNFSLPNPLLSALKQMDFNTPTPVQAQAIPLILEGRDILASAQTGTGKTGAFAIPLIAQLMQHPQQGALIVTPTRELAVQVHDVFIKLLGPQAKIRTALLVGGDPMFKQLKQLRYAPRVVVGTPGRINDHLKRGYLSLDRIAYWVLDETDRMLDMGFGIQIDQILKFLPEERQTLFFSATLPPKIVQLAQKLLKNPERIAIGATNAAAPQIQQETVSTTDLHKYTDLLRQIEGREGHMVIFVNTRHGAERLSKKLKEGQFSTESLHGNLKQRQRERVIGSFRQKKFQILVATDVAARGLDIPHIRYVINYDLPPCPEDYIHRIGRTGRAEASGAAINLLTPKDRGKWFAIQRLMNPQANQNQPCSQERQPRHRTRPATRGRREEIGAPSQVNRRVVPAQTFSKGKRKHRSAS